MDLLLLSSFSFMRIWNTETLATVNTVSHYAVASLADLHLPCCRLRLCRSCPFLRPCISLVSVLWQCVTNPCFAVADFRVGPQHPFAHDRSSSLSKPSEYGKPGVTFRTDQAQGDSRGRRYEQSKISTVLLTRLPYSLHNLRGKK